MSRESRQSLLREIRSLLRDDETISPHTKDTLMLMLIENTVHVMDEVYEMLGGMDKRVQLLEKYRPYLQAIAWVSGIIGTAIVILIWSIITGKATIIFN